MADFIGINALQEIAKKFSPQIVVGAAHFRPDVFTRMKIKVETGIEFQSIKTIMLRKGHTTERKVVGEPLNSTIGYMVERKCVARLTWNHYTDNKDKYIELAIVDASDNTKFNYPLSEVAMMAALANYGEDQFDCLFHGDDTIDKKDKTNPKWYLHLYTGLITYLSNDVAAGLINAANGNLVTIGAIDVPANKDDADAYNQFVAFRNQWHSNLQNAPEVLVYCSEATGFNIARAYKNANGGYEGVRYNADGTFKFPEWNNITVVPESALGEGDKLIATIPFNFEYCVDSQNSRTGIFVKEGTSQDYFDITYQVQSIQGTRVLNINASYFCMTTGSLVPKAIAGDYTKDLFVVSVNAEEMGTVTVNGAAPDNTVGYAANTSLELAASAKSGYEFVMWSDGVTSATRTVVTKGQPGGLIAIFKKTA
jgi:hypothetical protein